MHYHAEVWIPSEYFTNELVTRALAPYDENLEIEQVEEDGETWWTNPDGFWDWWQIGGRWRGAHVPDYDAEKDESLYQTCEQCGGTGDRPEWVTYELDTNGESVRRFTSAQAEHCNGCNGCKGTGKEMKWPTQWPPHPKDVIPVSEIEDSLTCYALILPTEVLFVEEYENGEFVDKPLSKKTIRQALEEHDIHYGCLVTVDYHR